MADQQSPVKLDAEKVPEILPILPLYDAVLFPKMVLPLVVLQGESVQLVDEAMAKDRIIGLMVSKKPEDKDTPGKEDLAAMGTSAMILKMAKTQDNRTQLLVQGLNRFKITAFEEGKPYLIARVKIIKDIETKDNEIPGLAPRDCSDGQKHPGGRHHGGHDCINHQLDPRGKTKSPGNDRH